MEVFNTANAGATWVSGRDERECFFSIPFHSHWLFPFPPASIPMQVDIFIAALLLIVFWVAEILKVKDTALLSWWAMTVQCVTVRRSSRM